MLILSVDAMHTRRAEWNRRQNPDFLVPQGIVPSQLLTESWVNATSLREDHLKLERRIPPIAGRTFLPKFTPMAEIVSLFHPFTFHHPGIY